VEVQRFLHYAARRARNRRDREDRAAPVGMTVFRLRSALGVKSRELKLDLGGTDTSGSGDLVEVCLLGRPASLERDEE